jgi:hypothetical protein
VVGLFAQEGLESLWRATHTSAFEELTFNGQGRSFQLAVECVLPESLRLKLQENNTSDAGYACIRYEIEIGRMADKSQQEPPTILAENLWLLGASVERPRHELVQSQFEFPSASCAEQRLIHDRAPKGWRKIAAKTSNQNSYFKSETTEWNFQIRNPAEKSALSTLPEDERFSRANWFKRTFMDRVQKSCCTANGCWNRAAR